MIAVAPTVGDLALERAISKVAESYRFVLDVTPVDAEEQRRAFLSGETDDPAFTYRELEDDPAVLLRELDVIELDAVDDGSLRTLLAAKHRETELQIEMLRARGSSDFLALSQELYGPLGDDLVRDAELILANVPLPDGTPEEVLRAAEVAAFAERELQHYRAFEPDIGVHVEVRPDVTGVMVSAGVLLVSTAVRVRGSRIHALLQHEVGTHLLTHVNGTFQPLEMLAAGTAGYEETQEGLAVLAEFLVGGLSRFRLRQLAARVLAVDLMTSGESFADVHQALVGAGFSQHSAFTTTMRVFRSGGFTKDAIYLRGFLNMLDYLRDGGGLDLLWIGKLSLAQLPLIEDLVARDVFSAPRLRPRYLDFPETDARLARAASLADLSDLIGDIG